MSVLYSNYSMVLSIWVLSIAVFTISKRFNISLLSRLEYLILAYLILLNNVKDLLQIILSSKNTKELLFYFTAKKANSAIKKHKGVKYVLSNFAKSVFFIFLVKPAYLKSPMPRKIKIPIMA